MFSVAREGRVMCFQWLQFLTFLFYENFTELNAGGISNCSKLSS